MYMQSDLIEVKVVDCAGTIIINRPEHENRLTRLMMRQLSDALDDLYHEKAVRAIILTGAADTFCAGIDLNEVHEAELSEENLPATQQRWGDDATGYRDLLIHMLQITKPIIASVNGPALSAGAGLVAASDIVVASDEARFGVPDPRFGLVAGVVGPLFCHRIGAGQATRLMLTSITLDGQQAHQLGLFHELVDSGKVWARAMELAEACAAGAPEAIQLTKRLLNETIGEHLETQLTTGAIMQATSFTTEAAQEGISAYLEDRPPEWP
ncbi:MAG: enoyl-CoA hydratase/isomerase family protein [Pirellulales bacterium]|nr:enoyl-CoA hydratase/isomerase family protein [Pirellulales bacterium]